MFDLFMYVVSNLDIFLNTFDWNVSTLFSYREDKSDPNPYSSFDLSTASAVYFAIATPMLLRLQDRSSFVIVMRQSANLAESSSLLLVFYS